MLPPLFFGETCAPKCSGTLDSDGEFNQSVDINDERRIESVNKLKIAKRILSFILCLVMSASMLPLSALAAEDAAALIVTVEEAMEAAASTESVSTAESVDMDVTAEAEQESEPLLAASGNLGTSMKWSLSNDGVLTISGTGEMPYCEMESQVPWKSYRFNIEKVVVEEGVTSVGPFAFYGCRLLKEVTLPDSVTVIYTHAFHDCGNLLSINLPGSLREIGVLAFADCSSLEEVTFPTTLKTLRTDAFFGCYGLESITFPGELPAIDATAFRYVTATAYYPDGDADWIANGLNDYGGTLTWKPLGEKPGPGDDPVVEEDACGDNLTWTLTEGGVLTISGSGPMWSYTETSPGPWYGEKVKKVVVEEGVTTIGAYAFYDSWWLTEVSLPDSLATIGNSAFHNCPVLPAITIPESVTTIGEWAFYVCESLQEITIPDSVTSLGREAFKYCTALTTVNLGDGLTNVVEGVFCECDSLVNITLGSGITKIYSEAFAECDSLTEVIIPARITLIVMGINGYSAGAFSACRALENIYVEAGNADYCSVDGVLYTGDMSTLVCVPAGRGGAFAVPSSVTEIGHSAFYGCNKLTEIRFSEALDSIASYALYDCDGLTGLDFPAALTDIDSRAVYDCDGLTEVWFRGANHPTMSRDSFEYTTATGYYPQGVGDWELYLPRLSVGGYGGKITWVGYTQLSYDISGEGVVDGCDLVLLMKHVIGLETANSARCNLNGDGAVDILDVIHMVRHLAELL